MPSNEMKNRDDGMWSWCWGEFTTSAFFVVANAWVGPMYWLISCLNQTRRTLGFLLWNWVLLWDERENNLMYCNWEKTMRKKYIYKKPPKQNTGHIFRKQHYAIDCCAVLPSQSWHVESGMWQVSVDFTAKLRHTLKGLQAVSYTKENIIYTMKVTLY